MKIKFHFETNELTGRLDQIIQSYISGLSSESYLSIFGDEIVVSRTKISKWIQQGYVFFNQSEINKPSFQVKSSATISLEIPEPKSSSIEADFEIPLEIVFEDQEIIVLNKQAGLCVHPGAGNEEGTIVNALVAHLGDEIKQIGDALRPGIVHRLDKDTSGLMVVAKTETAYANLQKQFEPPRTISRKYLALVDKIPKKIRETSGTIALPIARDKKNRLKMAVLEEGKEAKTLWKLKESFQDCQMLELELTTGRTHQIRVHLSELKMPIIGDNLYGGNSKKISRQALHAHNLSFLHPSTKERLEFQAELPEEMKKLRC